MTEAEESKRGKAQNPQRKGVRSRGENTKVRTIGEGDENVPINTFF